MIALWTILFLVTTAYAIFLMFRVRANQKARQTLEQFQRKFPGRCPICSYHQFRVYQGFEWDPEPPPHHCLDKEGSETAPAP